MCCQDVNGANGDRILMFYSFFFLISSESLKVASFCSIPLEYHFRQKVSEQSKGNQGILGSVVKKVTFTNSVPEKRKVSAWLRHCGPPHINSRHWVFIPGSEEKRTHCSLFEMGNKHCRFPPHFFCPMKQTSM